MPTVSPPTGRLRRALVVTATLVLPLLLGTGVSDPASAATPSPAGLTSTSLSARSATVTWSAVAKAPRYRLKYSTSTSFTKPRYTELTGLVATIGGLAPATRYYVKVRVVTNNGDELSAYSKPITVTTPTAVSSSQAAALRVASYNIGCANCFHGGKDEGTWAQRRGAVVAAIRAENLDVVGVQEASQGRIYDSETGSKNLSQYEDLVTRLGKNWKVTNTKRYNCVKDLSPNSCTYADKGASKGTRILYNSDRVVLVSQGSTLIPRPTPDDVRSVAYAVLRQRSTGRSFMFSNVHLAADGAKNYAVRKKQAEVAMAALKAHNPVKLPVIAVGDWNSSRFADPTNAPYDVYVKAGFVDPLGGRYDTTKTAPGATVEKRIQTWVSSSNRYTRRAPAHKDWVNGSYIDYLMTTPMRVSEWETVANLDRAGNFVGRIPSDHNMIRATVWLPV